MQQETKISTMEGTDNNTVFAQKRKRINRIKSAIIVIIIILFLLPTLLCIILGIRLSKLQGQVDSLLATYLGETDIKDQNKNSGQYAYASTDDLHGVYTETSNEVGDTDRNSLIDNADNTDNDDNDIKNNDNNNDDNDIKNNDIKNNDDNDIKNNDINNDDKNNNDNLNETNIDDINGSDNIDNANEIESSVNIDIIKKNDSDTTDSSEDINNVIVSDSNKDKPANDTNLIYEGKKVYLTFDDGPTKNTDIILDILMEHNIKATFFVIGHEDEVAKERYKRIVNEGHTIGIHSYSHNYKEIYKSIEDFDKDFTKLWKLLYDITGYTPTLYRFPGGSLNFVSKSKMESYIRYLNEKGMTYYDWNVVNGDAEGIDYTEEQMIDNVLYGVARKKTSIVLMHDGMDKNKTVDTLPKILEALISGGAELLPMDESVPLIQQIKATSVK